MKNLKILLLFFVTCLIAGSFALALDNEELPDNDNSYVYVLNKSLSEDDDNFSLNVLNKVDVRPMSYPNCSDVPLQLEDCKESICVDNTPFGKVFHKVKGKDDKGNCQYLQRTKGFGGINCNFQPTDFSNAGLLIGKFSNHFADPKVSLTSQETEQLKILLQKNCNTISNIALQEPIQIAKFGKDNKAPVKSSDEIAGIPDENYTFIGPSQAATDTALIGPSIPSAEENKTVPVSKQSTNNDKSIMFTAEIINLLEQTLQGKGDDNSFTSAALSGQKGIGFYLNSIIFFEPEKWAIWVNNKRIIKGEKVPDFDIEQVNHEGVVLKYNIKNLDKISPDWRKKLVATSPQSFNSMDNYIKLLLDAENRATIKVQLKPNQTFEISSMHIYEGQ